MSERSGYRDIAVIGIGLNMPGASTVDQFWDIVSSGKCLFTEIPPNRKRDLDVYKNAIQQTGKIRYEKGAYLQNIDNFDYHFFSISPREALMMDPAHRIFLQTAWHAVEDAGYTKKELRRYQTGVYVACSNDNSYYQMLKNIYPELPPQAVMGCLAPFMPGRMAHMLDLQGPNMIINTLCSSSLTAMHIACMAIRNKECDIAVVGGVQLHLFPVRDTFLGMESEDVIRTFDENANGTSAGEGVAVFVIKELEQAVNDKDAIYAVIKGSAVNHDGASIGITAPNPASQTKLLVSAWNKSGINPADITYIEAHGTGTRLGDPIEIEGITNAFSQFTSQKQFCAIGSVKTNFGHLDAAAGFAGLIKAVLALKQKMLLPTLHFEEANAQIDFLNSPVYVNNRLTPWVIDHGKRLCGVSSFGLSGTNCHMVLEEYEPKAILGNQKNQVRQFIFVLSAIRSEDLRQLAAVYKNRIIDIENFSVGDICYTLCVGREHYKYRLAVIVDSVKEIKEKLELVLKNDFWCDARNGIYSNIMRLLHEDEDIQQIDVSAGQLQQLAMAYIRGGEIDWSSLYSKRVYCRVHLPGYPFNKERVWPDMQGYCQKIHIDKNKLHEVKWIQKPVDGMRNLGERDVLLISDQNEQEAYKKALVWAGYCVDTLIYTDIEKMHEDVDGKNYWKYQPDKIVVLLPADILNWDGNIRNTFLCIQNKLRSIIQESVKIAASAGAKTYFVAKNGAKILNEDKLSLTLFPLIQGYIAVLFQEYPEIHFQYIDLDETEFIKNLISEISSDSEKNFVAYRKNKRYVKAVMCLNQMQKKQCIKKKGGTFLIAGGGNIGLNVAKQLTKRFKWNVAILTTRKESSLENFYNSNIRIYQADICCEGQLAAALEKIRFELGPISNILYTAGRGVGFNGMDVAHESVDDANFVMMPKTLGVCLLDRLTRKDSPYMFLCSSAISITGNKGSGCYAAANSFLNFFAEYRIQQGLPTVSLLLAPREKSIPSKADRNFFLFEPITIDDICGVLWDGVPADSNQIIVGNINPKLHDLLNSGAFPVNFEDNMIKINSQEKNVIAQIHTDQQRKVRLTGRKSGKYSIQEQKVAFTFGEHLGYNTINITDSFLQLGGDSITAVKVILDINREFATSLTVKDLLGNPVVSEFAKRINNAQETEDTDSIRLPQFSNIFELSSNQRQFYVLNQMGMDNLCHMIDLIEINGNIKPEKVESAVIGIMKRHQIFRVSIKMREGMPVHVVEDEIRFKLEKRDIEEEELDAEIREIRKPFDLTNVPLFRIKLLSVSSHKHYLLVNIHHIISDGITKELIKKDFAELYLGNKKKAPLLQYSDYVAWQKTINSELNKNFWLKHFDGYKVGGNEEIRSQNQKLIPAGNVSNELGQKRTARLNSIVQKKGITMYALLFAAYALWYASYKDMSDIVIGTVYSGRTQPQMQEIAGVFINTLPVRVICKNQSLDEFIKYVNNLLIDMFEYQDYPIHKILNLLYKEGMIYNNFLYDNVFIMQNLKTQKITMPNAIVVEHKIVSDYARMSMTVEVEECEGNIILRYEYDAGKFNDNQIQSAAQGFIDIIDSICDNDPIVMISEVMNKHEKNNRNNK